jgi:hypothetical protein
MKSIDKPRSFRMKKDKDFAVLVGKAFLHELEAGDTSKAIAFGRAFLLSLGMTSPEASEESLLPRNGHCSENLALVPN